MRRGFTWVEFLVILLVIAVAVLVSMPVFLHLREATGRGRCLSHLRSLGKAVSAYSATNNSRMPLSMPADERTWFPLREATVPAINKVDSIFWANATGANISDLECPSAGKNAYAFNGYMHALPDSSISNLKTSVLVWEGFGKNPKRRSSPRLDCGIIADPCGYFANSPTIAEAPKRSVWTHGRGANFLYVDGHAAWRRLGKDAGESTDDRIDPFEQYDRSGHVENFWIDGNDRVPIFKP